MEYDQVKPTVWAEKARTVGFFFYHKGGQKMTKGHVHSIESMGLVDGHGIRTVVFLQGCKLRCQYCHNPDTWNLADKAILMEPQELIRKLVRFKSYYKAKGGVTFSGGEPLLQKDFLLEVLPLCKEAGINTCLDTAGCGVGDYEKILAHTDLVILDIKHYTREGYAMVTGHSIDEVNKFLAVLQKLAIPLWLRHVVVPGLTDGDEHLKGLADYVKTIKNVERIELLPYHVLGVPKYKTLGIPYKLEGVPPMEAAELTKWQELLNAQLR